jgi:hypothetical protein
MDQISYQVGSYPPSPTQEMMMRPLEQDPSGTVRVLRGLSLIGLLLPVLLFAVAAWMDRSDILQNAERDGGKVVALYREQAGSLLTGHDIILDMVVDRMRGRTWDTLQSTDLLHELEVMDRRLDDASEILLVDAKGTVRATTAHVRPGQPLPTPDPQCFLALSRNEAASCISQPHIDPRSGHYLFSLSRRLEQGGVFSGIAHVAISADYIVDLWASAAPSASDIVTMFTSDGTVLAQSGQRSQAAPNPPDDVGKFLISQKGKADAGIIRAALSTDGVDRITVYSKLAEHPVYISLSLAKSEILKKWYTNLAVYGLVAMSATVGVMIALGIALRRARAFNSVLTANRRR